MTDAIDRLTAALASRYTIERELGAGGMATVYLSHDLKHERKVALKVLRPELAAVLGAERFVQEIKTTANLQHPHILPLFDSGEADGFLYYVMPFIDGETLRDKLNRETQLGIEEAVKITTEVADALDYAHRQNVIHRDIKPENILLHDGRPMVADFGIALAVSAAAGGRMTETGLSLGTPHYMSPEQATAEKELTNRSDIYSLGAVLYEMLTGDPPHTGSSAQQIIMKIVTEDVQPVTELRKSAPLNVAAATAKALEKLPADRFESAAQFARSLGDPTFTAGALTPGRAPGAHSDRWKRAAIGAVGLSGALIGLLAWSLARSDEPKSIARFPLNLPEAQAFFPEFGSGIALSPDGTRMVYSGLNLQTVGWGAFWLRDFSELNGEEIVGVTGNAHVFSPDGQSFAFVGPDSRGVDGVQVQSFVGGPPRTIAEPRADFPWSLDWEQDGYIYVQTRDGLERIPERGGDSELILPPDTTLDGYHFWTDVLPNGKGAIVSIVPNSDQLTFFNIGAADFATGAVVVLVQGVAGRYARTGHLVFVRDDGVLLAAPFDQESLQITGAAVPLAQGISIGPTGGARFALSDNGTLVYGRGDSENSFSEIVWVKKDGTARSVDSTWTGYFDRAVASPDGSQLAVTTWQNGQYDVWIKELEHGPFVRLTFEGGRNPVWSPDGRTVAFLSVRGADGGRDLYVKAVDGSDDARLVLDENRDIQEVQYAPDGEWMVYAVGRGFDQDLRAFRPGVDSVGVDLVATSFDERSPTVSADGRWLAYVSNESGRHEVYVRSFPDAGGGRVRVSTGSGHEPQWGQGGELFYLTEEPMMVAASMDLDSTPTVTSRRDLFPLRGFVLDFNRATYSVAPDGERLVMMRFHAGTPVELVVVQNFFEELKEKVGN